MKKYFYIIPGFQETCRRRCYQLLATMAQKKGYEVVFKNVDWKKNLSSQIFPIEANSTVFGFSLGAILAKLVVQNQLYNHVILGSMTPLRHFKGGQDEKLLIEVVGKSFVDDVKKNLKENNNTKKEISIYGDKENELADIFVLNTDHEINENYIKEIEKII